MSLWMAADGGGGGLGTTSDSPSIDSVENEKIEGKKDDSLKTQDEVHAKNTNIYEIIIAVSLVLLLIIVVLVTRPRSKKEEMSVETQETRE